MTVGEAKAVAKEWIEEKATEYPDFHGAYAVGSIVHMDDDDPFPSTSDVDLRLILDREVPGMLTRASTEFRQTKFLYKGVVLEPQYSRRTKSLNAEGILATPYAAYHWSVPNALLDPSGELAEMQREVALSLIHI